MRVTLRMLYEILLNAEKHMGSLQVQWFKSFVRQMNRFTRGEDFYLDIPMLKFSKRFLSSYSESLGEVDPSLYNLINELEEGLELCVELH